MDDEDPDPQAAIAAIQEDVAAKAAARAERDRARAEVLRRAAAAGWKLNWGTGWYVGLVGGLLGVYAVMSLEASGLQSLVWLAAWAAPAVLIVIDYRNGPLAVPRGNELKQTRWVVPVRCGILGAALGLAAGAVIDSIRDSSHGCHVYEINDCGFGLFLASIFVGIPAAVVVGGLVLLVARVRHGLTIAMLGPVFSFIVAAVGRAAWPQAVAAVVPAMAVVGAVSFAFAGAAHARAISPVTRATILATAMLAVTVFALVT